MVKRFISISTCFDYNIPIEIQIPLISHAGFSHISLGGKQEHSNYLSYNKRKKLKELLEEHSLKIDTIHGPNADAPDVIEKLTLIAEAAVELNTKVIVLHGGPFDFPENELLKRTGDLKNKCKQIEKISMSTGVKFAFENVMPGPATELIKTTILEVDSKYIGFCYDSSHDQIGGPNSFDLLYELKEKLFAVHLSDRIKEFVDHVVPSEGFIKWDDLCKVLSEANISFPLLLEVMVTNSYEKNTERFLKFAYDQGCILYDKVNVQNR